MRVKSFLLFISVLVVGASLKGQVNWQHKTDSVTRLIQQHYNAKKIASLYSLTGGKFRQAIPEEKFKELTEGLYSQTGSLASYTLISWDSRVAKYKAAFSFPMALYVGLDDSSKLETFAIRPWEEDTATKKGPVATNNPKISLLDRKVDSVIRPIMSGLNTVGLVIGILRNNSMQQYGYGETRIGNKKIPDENTLFEIGSMSKTFTATLLADLVNKKRLSLNDPVSKYLPDSLPALQFNGIPITIQTLSNHTSGLPRLPADLFFNADPHNPYKHYDTVRLFNFLKRFKPTREPGKQYEYSNLAVGLLGVILERVTGKSYEKLLQENICKPLRMNNTRLSLLAGDSVKFAGGHNMQRKPAPSWEFQSLAAAGGIRSSVSDMLLYAKAQVNDNSSNLQKAIALTHQLTFENAQNRVGLGWHIFAKDGKKYHAHNGQTGGYYSIMVFNTETNNAVVILTNASITIGDVPFSLISWLDQN